MASNDPLADVVKKLATTQNPKLLPIDTLAGHFQHQLYSVGLFEDTVLAVWQDVLADPANEVMADRWHEFKADYPNEILVVSWVMIKRATRLWLAANKPQHWARPMFD